MFVLRCIHLYIPAMVSPFSRYFSVIVIPFSHVIANVKSIETYVNWIKRSQRDTDNNREREKNVKIKI